MTSKLPALRAYQHSLHGAAAAEARASIAQAAQRGKVTVRHAPARPATSAATARTTTPASCISRRDRAWTAPMPCAPRTARIARRRCAGCGTIRRTSMTAAPRRSTTWWSTTTRRARCKLSADQQQGPGGVPEDSLEAGHKSARTAAMAAACFWSAPPRGAPTLFSP